MKIESKAEQLIIKLIRETVSGKVAWKIRKVPFDLENGTDDIFPLFLQTEYKKKKIGVYQTRYKSYIDEEEYHWSESIGFCILNNDDQIIWEFQEKSPALFELLNTAREQAAGINDLLGDLLDE